MFINHHLVVIIKVTKTPILPCTEPCQSIYNPPNRREKLLSGETMQHFHGFTNNILKSFFLELLSSIVLVVFKILRVNGSLEYSPTDCNLQNKQEDGGGVRRPSDGKVSFFWKTEGQNSSNLNQEFRTSFGVIRFSFMERERGSIFPGELTISFHKGRGR